MMASSVAADETGTLQNCYAFRFSKEPTTRGVVQLDARE
jgi:hypothetical protein